ncbi:MAG: hypothetical protein K2L11_04890 [Muribaculaceae bacterium]|nr:hypothetical protein [Muribaculaceae bacterium]
MLSYRNNLSGLRAPGYRFRFRVQAISHRALYLPRSMRDLDAVKKLLAGAHPSSVFATHDIHEARKRFNELRIRYDFPYWAATRFPIRHIDDPDLLTTLVLNENQHIIIDNFLKTYQNQHPGRFIITKNRPRCGVTTCVQAYIIWLQLFQTPKNSQTCGVSNFNLGRLKENIALFFNRDSVNYGRYKFPIRDKYTSAFFNTINRPDALRGIDFGYVHLVDMAKWKDPDGIRSGRAIRAALSGILLDYRTLIVMEGNIPSPKYNPIFYNHYTYFNSVAHDPLFHPINLP